MANGDLNAYKAGKQSPSTMSNMVYGGTTAGSANTYTLTVSGFGGTQYDAGLALFVKFHAANTSASTLNLNGLGAKNVFIAGAAATNGAIAINTVALLIYDGVQFNAIL